MPDLMIVDIGLNPGNRMAAIARSLQTGYVTHLYMSGVLPEYRTSGVPVLRKPFRATDLILSIEGALENHDRSLG